MKILVHELAGLLREEPGNFRERLTHSGYLLDGYFVDTQDVLRHLFQPLGGYPKQRNTRAKETHKKRRHVLQEKILPELVDLGLCFKETKANKLEVLQPGTGHVQIISVRMSNAGRRVGYMMSFSQEAEWPDWYLLLFPFGEYLIRPHEVLHGTHNIEFFTPDTEILAERKFDERLDEFMSAFTTR